jgi:hypothetical protein
VDRVFRAAGNHAGRSHLDSTAKLREPKPPRALILSTGEDIPRGQSIRSRLLILTDLLSRSPAYGVVEAPVLEFYASRETLQRAVHLRERPCRFQPFVF